MLLHPLPVAPPVRLPVGRGGRGRPGLFFERRQVAAAFLQIGHDIGFGRFFVGQLDALGPYLGLKPQLLSLLISPIATELPETLNAIIWIKQGKVRLALANISGAMMIQATVPTAFGLFWTPWTLDRALVGAGAVTLLAGVLLFGAAVTSFLLRRHGPSSVTYNLDSQ